MADARMQNEVESDLPQGEVRNESEMRQCARDKSVTDSLSGTGRLLDGSGHFHLDDCLDPRCPHICKWWRMSVKDGSESSMGSTRRVPLITSSRSPYVNSLSKSSELVVGPPLVWAPVASVLTVMSPYVRSI